MQASVIVNAHAGTDFDQFRSAADSVLIQDYDDVELVVVVADAPDVERRIEGRYGSNDAVRIVSLDEDHGLSTARNEGAAAASGEIVVFTDDDVVTEPAWIGELIEIYESESPAGVGGHVTPIWPEEKPWYFPSEFFWLVGAMQDNFVTEEKPQRVRNTFGCNISFDRSKFLEAGGFREDLGKNQEIPLQGEEAEFCERLDGEFWYTPHAIVRHRVDSGQLSMRYLFRRAFWQGVSKAALTNDTSGESSFLKYLATDSIPRRIATPSREHIAETAMILVLTTLVGVGFVYGKTIYK